MRTPAPRRLAGFIAAAAIAGDGPPVPELSGTDPVPDGTIAGEALGEVTYRQLVDATAAPEL